MLFESLRGPGPKIEWKKTCLAKFGHGTKCDVMGLLALSENGSWSFLWPFDCELGLEPIFVTIGGFSFWCQNPRRTYNVGPRVIVNDLKCQLLTGVNYA